MPPAPVCPRTRRDERFAARLQVIVDAAHFGQHLPAAVEALFFIGYDSTEHCSSTNHWANVRGGGRREGTLFPTRAHHVLRAGVPPGSK